MFLQIFVVVVILAVAFAELDPKLIAQLANKRKAVKNAKHSNRKISAAEIKAQTIPSKYLQIQTFPDTAACAGTPNLSMGLAFDVCIAGDVNPTDGTPLTSIKYYTNDAGSVYMSYFSDTGDCSGTSTDNAVSVPTPCINNNMLVTAVESTDPWTTLATDGVVVKFFADATACAAGGSGYDYLWYAAGYCIPDAAEDGSYLSYNYGSCSADSTVTVNYYTDNACTTLLRTETPSLSSCMQTTSNLQPAWVTQSCTSATR